MNLHFISGLPRSGSTLLAAILRQNPAFHAEMSSPLHPIVQAMRGVLSRRTEGIGAVSSAQKERLLYGIVHDFYVETPASVVFDTNRGWLAMLPLLTALFPEARLLCCVRDIAWILDSFERALARNPTELSGIWNFDATMTMVQRVSGLASSNGLVGWALDALREACAGPFKDRLLLVEYDALCQAPGDVMGQIYEYLGEPRYRHDFENLDYSAPEFDAKMGMPELHTVKGPVVARPRETILPPRLFTSFSDDTFWRSADGVRVIA